MFYLEQIIYKCVKNSISFFSQTKQKRRYSLGSPKLYIDNNQIQRSESIKFLGVFLDENLTWKEHIKYIENKIPKTLASYLDLNLI